MAKAYKYTAKNGDTVVCEISVFEDGHWELDAIPSDLNAESLMAYRESCTNGINRLLQQGITQITVKKV